MRRLLLAILALAPLLAGCWDQFSIERLGFVTLIGIDGVPGKIHAIMGTVIPDNLPSSSSAGAKGPTQAQYVGNGRTLFEAIRQADRQAPKRLFVGQIESVVIGEQLAKAGGMRGVIDYFGRENKSRNIAWVFTAKSQDLPKLMTLNPPNAAYPAQALDNLGIIERLQGDVVPRRIFDVGDQLTAKGTAVSLPRVTTIGQNFALDGTDLFRDNRMVGHVGDVSSRGIALLTGPSTAPYVDASCPGGGKASIVLQSVRPTLGADVVQGEIRSLWIRFRAAGNIVETSGCPYELLGPHLTGQIYTSAANNLELVLATTVRELQTYGSDVVGFGEHIREHYPDAWQRVAPHWHEGVFPRLSVAISVEVHATNTGLRDKGQ